MTLRTALHLLCILTILAWMSISAIAEDELVVRYFGKTEAVSVDGKEQLDVFFITNKTTSWKVFALYWFAKTNSHQVGVATWATNTIVDWGDSIFSFHTYANDLSIYPGFTNVADPFSENEMRKHCAPIFKALLANEGFSGIKRLAPESELPKLALGPIERRTYGFHPKITNVTVTKTNVTLEFQGVQGEDNDRTYPTNNVGKLTFGRDLNLIEAKVITNSIPPKAK
jgi:hypothetical protein